MTYTTQSVTDTHTDSDCTKPGPCRLCRASGLKTESKGLGQTHRQDFTIVSAGPSTVGTTYPRVKTAILRFTENNWTFNLPGVFQTQIHITQPN